MTRITIVPDDNIVHVDGEARNISMAGIDPTIHAVQWFGATGEIEFNDGKPHEQIDDITPFQGLLQRWTDAAPPPPPPPPPPPLPSAADVSVEELITQMIVDGTMTPEKIAAIKAAR